MPVQDTIALTFRSQKLWDHPLDGLFSAWLKAGAFGGTDQVIGASFDHLERATGSGVDPGVYLPSAL
jgi:hypothetical protein